MHYLNILRMDGQSTNQADKLLDNNLVQVVYWSVLLVLLILAVHYTMSNKQCMSEGLKNDIYTSGSTIRRMTEFSSTNQENFTTKKN